MFAIKIIDETSWDQDETMARVRSRFLFSDLLENGFLALARDSSSPPQQCVMEKTMARFLAAIFLDMWIRPFTMGDIFCYVAIVITHNSSTANTCVYVNVLV